MAVLSRVNRLGRDRDLRAKPLSCAHAHAMPIHIVPYRPRKRVTIEELLVWAYRTELVHHARPEGMPAEACRDFSPGPVEWRVDRIDSSAGFGFSAADDAYRVHAAVQALGSEPIRIPAWQAPASLLSRGELPERGEMRSGSRAQLVMTSALRGPPEWCPRPELEVIRTGTIYETYPSGQIKRTKAGAPIANLCMIKFTGDLPWIVDSCRHLYTAWVDALAELRDSLVLTAHTLTDELPPRSPWESC
jgi:hypothetical protein